MGPLIGVAELASNLHSVHLFDLRWDLTDPGKGHLSYAKGHIPGAMFVDLDQDLAAPPGPGGRHPLPEIARFARTLGRLGVTPDTHVVVYDDAGGRIAARMWWMLRAIGHERVQVLDGGYQAWIAAGNDVGVGTVEPEPATYPTPEGYRGALSRRQIEGRTLVDAREGDRYRGETEPVDPKAGHIPGAINIPASRNLDDGGRFHPAGELADLYSGLPPRTAVSCGSGVTACHTALAMVVAGHEMPEVYVGSFSEWSRLDLPVTTGPNA